MKKILLILLLMVFTFLLGVARGQYSPLGHWLYKNATELEASFYGLEQKTIRLNGENPVPGPDALVVYHHENPGKPAIVMLHGYSADKDVWPRFAKHFTDDYEVIIPDMAGHGDTGFAADWDYTMPAQAERLSRLLQTLNVAQAHIIGNSMGGFLTAMFAIRYPQQTLSATMVDPAGIESYPQNSVMENMVNAGHNPFFIYDQQGFSDFYAMTMEFPPFLPDIVLNAIGEDYIRRRPQLEVIFEQFYGVDFLDDQFPALTAPAMLWWGSEDQLLHVSGVQVWQQHLPQLEVHIFDGVGHMPMLEVSAASADIYHSFLKRLAAGND